jgi:hypothetical protein
VKTIFVNSFNKNHIRYSDDQLIEVFTKYKSLLDDGTLLSVDDEAMKSVPRNIIDYNKVAFEFRRIETEARGFTFHGALKKIAKQMIKNASPKEKENLKASFSTENIRMVRDLMAGKIVEVPHGKYTFKLIYNIGVIKKIKCETKKH